jgi:hypothetical protein
MYRLTGACSVGENAGQIISAIDIEGNAMRYIRDLLLTDNFLIKGHIHTGGQRLSTFLNNTPRSFLEIEETTLTSPVHSERIAAARIMVRVDEIILAHEIEEAGDESLRLLAEMEKNQVEVTAFFGGTRPFQLAGKVSERAIERTRSRRYDFMVVVEPKFQETTGQAGHDYSAFENLPYVIANRNRVSMIFRSPVAP